MEKFHILIQVMKFMFKHQQLINSGETELGIYPDTNKYKYKCAPVINSDINSIKMELPGEQILSKRIEFPQNLFYNKA